MIRHLQHRLGRAALVLGLLAPSSLAVPASPAQAALTGAVNIAPMRVAENRQEMIRDLDEAKALGADAVRTEIRWDLLEPARGVRDPAYLSRLDDVFAAAKKRGLRMAVVFLGTPCWASASPQAMSSCSGGGTPEPVAAYAPTDPALYAEQAAFLAARFAPTLGWLEVWNEPDHVEEVYWGGPDKAKSYAALLKATYPAVRRAAPAVKVLGGAIVGANGAFLKALYDNGAKGSYDALSVHYYDLVLASVRSIRDTMRAAGDTKPVWLGEFGWTSCLPARTEGGHACVSPTVQGRNTKDVLRDLRRASYVQGAVLYTLRDTGQYKFGLLTLGGVRKPAFKAVRDAFAGRGAASKVTLRLRRSGGRIVASGSGPAGDALELRASKGGRLRYKVTFRLNRDRTYRLRLPPQLGTRGVQVRVHQYWSGRQARRGL
jgi:polysaccharide biosynthesis protein PslG